MPRPLRAASPGDYFHVVNHGQAHAPLFETGADVERLLSLLGWGTSQEWFDVVAYFFGATHVHLLLRTLDGQLSDSMRRVESSFAIWHNRARNRVGHVVKGRYHARPVMGGVDLAIVLAYIDWNPVAARMCASPDAYPHGSARFYVHGGGPWWLARPAVEQLICRLTETPVYDGAQYPRLWAWAQRAGARSLLARAREDRTTGLAHVPILAAAGPEYVQRWLREHLVREEGRSTPTLLVAPEALLAGTRELTLDSRDPLLAGVLSQLCGCSSVEIAELLKIPQRTAHRRVTEHRTRLMHDADYAARAGHVTQRVLRETYGALANG